MAVLCAMMVMRGDDSLIRRLECEKRWTENNVAAQLGIERELTSDIALAP